MKKFSSLVLLFFFFLEVIKAEGSEETDDEIDYHQHPHGSPVSILRFDNDGKFIINNQTMKELFLHPEVKDRKIVAVSIIGAFRKGKSFLMDYALRYMYGHYKSINYTNNPLNNTENWMGEPEEILLGFSWRGGVERDTNGVIMWSDIFLHETKNGKKLAIILLDTQGLFDKKTSPTDNSRIFSLGTLASSIQIFNLNDVIQENQLEYLHLATEFSQFALNKQKEASPKKRLKTSKPFQNLIFLLRDWQNKQEFEYGFIGGSSYLASVLATRDNQPESLRSVREFIKKSFEKQICFLMPHPGTIVTSDPDYEGQRSGLDEIFEKELQEFLTYTLKPNNLVAKKILGMEVSAAEYQEYLEIYFEAFQSNDIPKVETLHTITIRKQYDILIAEYLKKLKEELRTPDYDSLNFLMDLDSNVNLSRTNILQKFKKQRKLGSQADEIHYTKKLEVMIDTEITEWRMHHVKRHDELVRIKQEKIEEIKEFERHANEKLKELQTQAAIDVIKMIEQQQQREREMNETLKILKEESERQLQTLREDYEKGRNKTEQQDREAFEQQKSQNEELKRKLLETQKRYQEELFELKAKTEADQKRMEHIIAEKLSNDLLRMQSDAQQRRLELERQLKLAESKQKLEYDQKLFENKLRIEELRIREEAETERRRQLNEILAEHRKEIKRLQDLILSNTRSG